MESMLKSFEIGGSSWIKSQLEKNPFPLEQPKVIRTYFMISLFSESLIENALMHKNKEGLDGGQQKGYIEM